MRRWSQFNWTLSAA